LSLLRPCPPPLADVDDDPGDDRSAPDDADGPAQGVMIHMRLDERHQQQAEQKCGKQLEKTRCRHLTSVGLQGIARLLQVGRVI